MEIYPQFVLIHLFLLERSRDFTAPTYFYVCFIKAFPKGEYGDLAFSVICLEINSSSPVRYSYLSIFPYDDAYIFAASLLIWYCSFSSLNLSTTVMISFYILSKRFFLKYEGLSDARTVSVLKKNIVLQYIFCKDS